MSVLIAKRETTGNGSEMTHTGTKAKTRVRTRVRSITAHMTDDQYDHATTAADICKLTDSRFGTAAIWVIAELTKLRAEHGWRRVLKRQWWKILRGAA